MTREAHGRAYSALRRARLLPDFVFSKKWRAYYKFESDYVFDKAFVDTIKSLLALDNSQCSVVLNITRSIGKFEQDEIDFNCFTITPESINEDYKSFVRQCSGNFSWLYSMDRFAATSERGQWQIYCEKENDLALLAIDLECDASSQKVLRDLFAESISCDPKYINSERTLLNKLEPKWRRALVNSYGVD